MFPDQEPGGRGPPLEAPGIKSSRGVLLLRVLD